MAQKNILTITALVAALALAGCGGGGSKGYFNTGGSNSGGNTDGGSTPTTPATPTAELLSIGQSKSSLNAGGEDKLTLTIRTLDTSGGIVANAAVKVEIKDAATSGASLSTPTSLVTSESGVVTTDITLSNSNLSQRINRAITVVVSSGKTTQELEIPVNGTALTIASDVNLLEVGTSANVTLTALDAVGAPLAGATASLTDTSGNTIGTTKVTDNTGRAVFQVPYNTVLNAADKKLELTGKITVNTNEQIINNLLTTETVTLIANVANDVLKVISDSTGVGVGESKPITVQVQGVNRAALEGKTVNFDTTNGEVNPKVALITNIRQVNGQWLGDATTNLIGAIASVATVSAQFGNNTIYIAQQVNAGVPKSITIQAETAVLAPGANTKVVALVKDANGSPIPNTVVRFNIVKDTSLTGRISQPTAITDSAGRATVIYTAGSAQTLGGGVEIRATAGDATVPQPIYSENLRLTVSTQAAFITVAHNHEVIKNDNDNTYYYKDFSVSVVDTAGNAIPNQEVSISLDLTHFIKGYYDWVYDYHYGNSDTGWSWFATRDWYRAYTQRFADSTTTSGFNYREVVTYVECPSDEFQNPVAILEADGTTFNTTQTRFKTDAQGKFDFRVRYGRNYSNWVRVNLNASTLVSTKESLTALSFMPPVAAADVDDEGRWRPDRISPYGRDFTTCTNYK